MTDLKLLKRWIAAKLSIEWIKLVLMEEAYIVGGAVRDIFMGLTPNDFDLVTTASLDDLKQLFPYDSHGKEEWGVHAFRFPGGPSIEIRSAQGKSIEDDALNRDFTINAIYLDPTVPPGKGIRDPQNGIMDIQDKILRCCGGSAIKTFDADPIRVYRAKRFIKKFGLVPDFDLDWYVKLFGNCCNPMAVKQEQLKMGA